MAGLRALLGTGLPLIAASFDDSAETGGSRAHAAWAAGLDVAELRIDLFTRQDPEHVAAQAAGYGPVPTLATVRSPSDGGRWAGTEPARRELFEAVLPHVDALDLELSSALLDDVAPLARAAGALVVASVHDFGGTPSTEELEAALVAGRERGADLVKVAATVTAPADLRRLAAFAVSATDRAETGGSPEVVVIGMGEQGAVSRVCFGGLGSRLTFCYLDRPSAPGQLEFGEALALYRRLYPAYAAHASRRGVPSPSGRRSSPAPTGG